MVMQRPHLGAAMPSGGRHPGAATDGAAGLVGGYEQHLRSLYTAQQRNALGTAAVIAPQAPMVSNEYSTIEYTLLLQHPLAQHSASLVAHEATRVMPPHTQVSVTSSADGPGGQLVKCC